MIIAGRTLQCEVDGTHTQIEIKIYAPERDKYSWICRYEIDWPSGVRSNFGVGFDAVQALHLTLQKIGLNIYMSEYHSSGRLFWGVKGAGCGFTVPKNGRDFLIGDDLIFEG